MKAIALISLTNDSLKRNICVHLLEFLKEKIQVEDAPVPKRCRKEKVFLLRSDGNFGLRIKVGIA